MKTEATTQSQRSGSWTWVLGFVAVLAVYVLGCGPVTVWEWTYATPDSKLLAVAEVVYAPITWATTRSPRCWWWHQTYCNWCAGMMGAELPGGRTYD